MKIIFLLCFLLLISIDLRAQNIRILTWNTFLIPHPFNSTKQEERADLMANKLRGIDYDIIFFQEAFLDEKRELIIKELASIYPYTAVPKKGQGFFQLVGSGLFIVSKYPMKVLDQVVFDDCIGTDCFASKSAIMVEITLPDNTRIQMLNTHLQGWKNFAIRKNQLLQIKNMMKANFKPGIVQVLVGDLNIDGNIKPEYANSLMLMEMTSIPLEGKLVSSNGFSTVNCFETPGGENNGEWLDHVWLRPNGSGTEVRSKNIVPVIGHLGSLECPLSDHYAVGALVEVKNFPALLLTKFP